MRLTDTLPPLGGEPEPSSALRVTMIEIRVDTETRDRLFVVRTVEGPPLMFRVDPLLLSEVLTTLARVVANSLN